jgi:DNA-binding MarR family transcriptional regulator
MTDELESLVVSGKDIDRKLIAQVLSPYVKLDKDDCNVRPVEGWNKLKAYEKIVVYILSRKAMAALNFNIPSEGASASEVARDTGLKTGTVNPALRELLDDRLVDQGKDGRYFIPNHAIEKIKAMLSKAVI